MDFLSFKPTLFSENGIYQLTVIFSEKIFTNNTIHEYNNTAELSTFISEITSTEFSGTYDNLQLKFNEKPAEKDCLNILNEITQLINEWNIKTIYETCETTLNPLPLVNIAKIVKSPF